MNISFNNRYNVRNGRSYYKRDFRRGPAQEAGLWLPMWFQFPKPILTLPGTPTINACTNLLHNKTPDGTHRLTLRSNTTRVEEGNNVANHRAGHELTFSAKKWITLLALCFGDLRILTVWQNIIWEALILAATFAATRVRKNGADHDRNTSHVIGLLIHHIESRAGDAQLHSHAIFFNVTWDPVEACFKALQFDPILQQKELICRCVEARLLEELWGLGYDMELTDEGFRIAGVPEDAEFILSKRARSLDEFIQSIEQQKGKVSWKEKKNFIISNRPAKKTENLATMQKRWRSELAVHREVLEKVVAEAKGRHRQQVPRLERHDTCAQVLNTTLDHLLEKYACVTPEVLLTHALARANGRWNGNDARAVINIQIEKGFYLRETGNSLTTPARRERRHNSLMEAHAAIGPQGSMVVRSPCAKLQHALHLAISGAKLIVVATETTPVCKAAVRGFDSGLRIFGLPPIYAMPASVDTSGLSVPLSQALANIGRVVVVGQAEKITQSELDAIIRFAAHPESQVILLSNQTALKDQKNPSLIAAFAYHRWVPLTNLTYFEQKSKRHSPDLLVPPSARVIEKVTDRAVSKVAEIAASYLASSEMVQVVTDDLALEAVLSAEIENQLEQYSPGGAITISNVYPIPQTTPKVGGSAISESKTRYFAAGECVRVVDVSDVAITVMKANGENIPVKPKVWNKLIPINRTEIQVRPGTVLTLTSGVPGKKHRLSKETAVQVKKVTDKGAISLSNGEELPDWFRFFKRGYVVSPTKKTKKMTGKAIVILRKRPSHTMRFLIRDLLRTGKLLKLVTKRTAHLKSMSQLVVERRMAKAEPAFRQPQQQSTTTETIPLILTPHSPRNDPAPDSATIVNSAEEISVSKQDPLIASKPKIHNEPEKLQQPDHP